MDMRLLLGFLLFLAIAILALIDAIYGDENPFR
jgi:hypothetical protein